MSRMEYNRLSTFTADLDLQQKAAARIALAIAKRIGTTARRHG